MMKYFNMSAIVSTCLILLGSAGLHAQNDLGKADDLGRIVLNPLVVSNAAIPSYAEAAVKNKLSSIAAKQGLGGTAIDERFVITANLIELTKDITPTAPPMVAITLAPTIYIGDAFTGDLYSSCDLPAIKGVGTNDTKAYLAAVKNLKADSPAVVQCIAQGKQKIVEFYNSQIDFLIAEAESMAQSQKFDQAMLKLAAVPEICKQAYMRAKAKIGEIYQQKIDIEGMKLYNEAYAQWNTAKTRTSGERVVELLAQINPLSSAAGKGRSLVKAVEAYYSELEARRRELEEKNWEFKMRQYEDKQANLVADRENAHELNITRVGYDYDVHMEQAKNGGAAAEYALQTVKEILPMVAGSSGTGFGKSVFSKVVSWFK